MLVSLAYTQCGHLNLLPHLIILTFEQYSTYTQETFKLRLSKTTLIFSQFTKSTKNMFS
jgi:hypothetical protein